MKRQVLKYIKTIQEPYEETISAEYDEQGNVIKEEHTETKYKDKEIWLPVIEEVPDEEIPQVEDTRTYEEKLADLIREKYSQSQVEAIFANYLNFLSGDTNLEHLNEYTEFQAYRKACKEQLNK